MITPFELLQGRSPPGEAPATVLRSAVDVPDAHAFSLRSCRRRGVAGLDLDGVIDLLDIGADLLDDRRGDD